METNQNQTTRTIPENLRLERRKKLGEKLEKILGSKNVYFQPPENFKLQYPCIVYDTGAGLRMPADNQKYLYFQGYSVTFITRDPDPIVPDKILELPHCQFERPYKADNLYHWVFFIYA